MSVSTADVYEAINATWNAAELDVKFRALWPASVDGSRFPVLNDGEAGGNQPFPYCVLEVGKLRRVVRMSNTGISKWEVREVPVTFHVHADAVVGDSRSSKQIAAYLVEEVMKVFGGHPTDRPEDLSLANGNFLEMDYESDFCVRTELYKYQWSVSYIIVVDVPVAV